MHRLLIPCTLLICTLSATAAQAAEQLAAQVPEQWFMGVNKTVGELHIQEFFPPGTEDYWEQKIVYESLTSDTLPEPIEYSQGLADQQAERCAAFKAADVFVGFENQYPTVVSVLECGSNNLTGKPLVTMLKVIKGNRSLYTVTRIWRLDPKPGGTNEDGETEVITDPAALVPGGEFAAWSRTLRDVILCDTSLAAHPCGK